MAHGDCSPNVGDSGWGRGRRPVANVSWDDAKIYVAWLSRITGKKYRLLSEAEFEYSARSRTQTAYPWGDEIQLNGMVMANCNGCGSPWDDRLLATVDSFAPNPFGLYGILGNAWQWMADCWHPSYLHAPDDGSAWVEKSCTKHVIRGGSWNNLPVLVRSASRSFSTDDGGDYDYSSLTGFRVARDLP